MEAKMWNQEKAEKFLAKRIKELEEEFKKIDPTVCVSVDIMKMRYSIYDPGTDTNILYEVWCHGKGHYVDECIDIKRGFFNG
jgi:hypothetical protein